MSGPEDFLERWSRRKREAMGAGAPEAAIESPTLVQIGRCRKTMAPL